jgi:hypothetical protein
MMKIVPVAKRGNAERIAVTCCREVNRGTLGSGSRQSRATLKTIVSVTTHSLATMLVPPTVAARDERLADLKNGWVGMEKNQVNRDFEISCKHGCCNIAFDIRIIRSTWSHLRCYTYLLDQGWMDDPLARSYARAHALVGSN